MAISDKEVDNLVAAPFSDMLTGSHVSWKEWEMLCVRHLAKRLGCTFQESLHYVTTLKDPISTEEIFNEGFTVVFAVEFIINSLNGSTDKLADQMCLFQRH